MTFTELKDIAQCGETTTTQFKQAFPGQKEIAREMVAMANTRGGRIIFGIADKTGMLMGLSYEEVQIISRELGNAANEQVRPTIYINTEVVKDNDRLFLICFINEGRNKPYKNLNGEIWIKQGADKRRITENAELLSLFQESGNYMPDASPVADTTLADLDRYALDAYFERVYAMHLDDFGSSVTQMLRNIHILTASDVPTMAGYLFFGRHPEYNLPTCMVKAVSFYGNELSGTQYRDTKEITGNMPQIYDKCMSFLKANLHNLQEPGASFNTLGRLEIAETVLEEVVQNALVHRDLLRQAPIRIFIFDNRVEVVSPGALAGGLTVDDIRHGKTYQRNPFMATFATHALRYRGIGSGIVRMLSECPTMEMVNDSDAHEFKVILHRGESTQKGGKNITPSTQKPDYSTQKNDKDSTLSTQNMNFSTQKTTAELILDLLRINPQVNRKELAKVVGITEDGIKKQLANLKQKGVISRIGPDRGGYWQVN